MTREKHIAGLGFPLPDDRVAHIERFDGPETLYGFDLIVWDVQESLKGVGRISHATSQRRLGEFRHHSGSGKPLVVLLPPPTTVPSSTQGEVLEMPSVMLDQPVTLVGARGSTAELATTRPEFHQFWAWAKDIATFESYMTPADGEPLLRIRGTERVVASTRIADGARVFYLPRLDPWVEYEDEAEASAASDLVDELLTLVDAFPTASEVPSWTDRYSLPGEKALVAAITRDERTIALAGERVRERTEALRSLRSRKHLIAGQGAELEDAVASALEGLGFRVEPGTAGRADRVIRHGRRVAVVEIKGKAKSAAERDAAQLEKWVSHHHANSGAKPKGILVVNGWMRKPLDQRPAVFPEQMLKYSRDERTHCLVTGFQLLNMWSVAEADPKRASSLRRLLLDTAGRVSGFDDPRGL